MTPRLGTLAMLIASAWVGAPAAGQGGSGDRTFVAARDGALVHRGSGLRFPETAAGFRRTATEVFDPDGEYVGVGYAKSLGRDGSVELRIAVVRIREMSPRAHYLIAKPMALRGLSDPRPVAEGPYDRAGGATGYRGLHAARRGDRPVMVGLWAFERGEWDLRVRAEFPASRREEADRAVGEFVDAVGAVNRRDPARR